MPQFGADSIKQLATADPRLQTLFNEVIKHYDCKVLEGHRNEADQNRYYDQGKSKKRWPNGEHNSNPSRAVDVVPYPIDWSGSRDATNRFYHFAGFVQGMAASMGLKIRWGGDWDSDRDLKDQTFFDLPHFEIKE